jgi:amino acid adenylation domain-containing protein
MIAEQTGRSPSATAVDAWDAQFTYTELSHMASRLATHLIRLGAGPEVLIPFCFEKSAWAIVAILAIMKSGAAFVPLDPAHPDNYIQDQLQRLNAKFIVVSPNLSVRLGNFCEPVVLSVDTITKLSLMDEVERTSAVIPSNAVYVLFTSGSTGKPKGVVLEHRNISSSICHHGHQMGFSSESRVFQFSAYTFDASMFEIFNALCWGGCVCIPSDEQKTTDIAWAMREMRTTISFLTPTVARFIQAREVPALRTLVLGGEAIGSDNIAEWSSSVDLISGYGPTECSMCSAFGHLTEKHSGAGYIGSAIGSTSWIANPANHHRLVPVGVIGELLTLGPIVARGYHDDEEKTNEAFIKAPTWVPNELQRHKLYKTGDFVRYNNDGSMSYIGRKDSQVKYHGQRIELNAIEHYLNGGDFAEHAIVTIPASGLLNQQLVALISLRNRSSTSANNELRLASRDQQHLVAGQLASLQEKVMQSIPGHMVPTVWVTMQSIPMTQAGKIDRVKISTWVQNITLADYNEIMQFDAGEMVPQNATEMELRLQAIWSRVLNIQKSKIGLNRSFFRLGGDSITAMQIVAACRAESIHLRMQDVLQAKTITSLASRARISGQTDVATEEHTSEPFGISPIQQIYFDAMVPEDQNISSAHHFNQSFLLRLVRIIEPKKIASALKAIIQGHPMLRARFHRDIDGTWMQSTVPKHGFLQYQENEVETYNMIQPRADALRSMINIENGPTFAAALFTVRDGHQYLFLVAHHLVVDLVSWRIIWQNLEEHLKTGSTTSPTSQSFRSWLKIQDENEKWRTVKTDLNLAEPIDSAFWDMEDMINIQADRIDELITLDESVTSALLSRANEPLRTKPFEIIISALIHAFIGTFPERAVPAFFIEGHGRESSDPMIDVSETVGWFTTISRLTTPGFDATDLWTILKQTKDTRRANDLSWILSQTAKANAQPGSRTPLEVLFNYTGRQQQLERDDTLLAVNNTGEVTLGDDVGKNLRRLALFEVDVAISNDVTKISFAWNRLMKHQDRILEWMQASRDTLVHLVRSLCQKEHEYTLSDFPLLSSDYAGLQSIEEQLLALGLSGLDDVEDIYQCSPMQEGILMSQMRLAGSYEVQQISRITAPRKGFIDVERLKIAWQQVVNRHAILRTVFIRAVIGKGLFIQAVLKIHVADVVTLDASSADEAVEVLRRLESIYPIDTRPAHRLTICKVSTSLVFYKVEISHSLLDGMSKAVVMQDLSQAYEHKLSLTPAPRYREYIQYLQKQSSTATIDYWKTRLQAAQPCMIPLSSKPRGGSINYDTINVNVDPVALHGYCNRHGLTLASFFKAAWGIVLRAFTSSDQVCFGYLTSGRDIDMDGAVDCVGVFINMLICQLDILPDTQIRSLIQAVQDDYLQSLTFQHCSLAEIQHGLKLGSEALFNTVLSIQRLDTNAGSSDSELEFEAIADHDPTEVSPSFGPRVDSLLIVNPSSTM